MEIGQAVIWRWYPSGPQGASEDWPAVVVKIGRTRICVEVETPKAGKVRRWVLPQFIISEDAA